MKDRYILKRFNSFLIDFIVISFLVDMFTRLFINTIYLDSIVTKINELLSSESFNLDTLILLLNDYFSEMGMYYINAFVIYIIYFTILTKLFKNRTLGCIVSRLAIINMQNKQVSYSDLTIKMLFSNGGIVVLINAIVTILFHSDALVIVSVMALTSITYTIFLIVNAIFLIKNGISLVDRLSKIRPLLVVKVK